MQKNIPRPLSPGARLCYAVGSAAFTLLERMILLFMPFFYLPPREYGLPDLLPERTYLGVFTVLGLTLLAGRFVDGIADPLIASLSDNNRSRIGRRRLFLFLGGLPLALSTLLVFHPPHPGETSLGNSFWLGAMLVLFYFFFTAYVNPYLALLPELGHDDRQRINLSTLIALFGLLGLVLISLVFPMVAVRFQAGGLGFRESYQGAAVLFSVLALGLLYAVPLGLNERLYCRPPEGVRTSPLASLLSTLQIKPFRILLGGEMFLQLAMNLITLSLVYYAVVLFQRGEGFMTLLTALAIGGALLFFLPVNNLARKHGKKVVISAGALVLFMTQFCFFLFSFSLEGFSFYAALAMFFLAGFPLAVLTILINPTIADLARADYYRTGKRREAMFYGARAIPLKLTVALAGLIFALLLSVWGRDLQQPLGVQLSGLLASLAAGGSYCFFRSYPEREVYAHLAEHENNIALEEPAIPS